REPTTWQRYRSFIITGLTVLAIQALLIAGLVINLSRRRKADRSLRESEERMKLAATAASLSIWERDFATNKIWLDERAQRNTPAKFEHESDYHLFLQSVHPDDRDAVALAGAKATSGDGNYEHVHRQLLPDGQLRWLAARGQVEFDAHHKPVKIRGVTMDVTAQKLAEEQARESDRQFMLIANSAPVLIWTSGTDKLCTFFNQPWLEFTGRT